MDVRHVNKTLLFYQNVTENRINVMSKTDAFFLKKYISAMATLGEFSMVIYMAVLMCLFLAE